MNPSLEMQVKEIQVHKTYVGGYTVNWAYTKAPLDVQEKVFADNNIVTISPAELGLLRANASTGIFDTYSRTRYDVLHDDRIPQVVIVQDGAISRLVSIADLVAAHKQGEEFVIPKSLRRQVYATVDEMIEEGTAFPVNYGRTDVSTSKFGKNKLTSKLFSDLMLGINPQDYGNLLKGQGIKKQSFFFDTKDYAIFQEGPYLNGLGVYGPDLGFSVRGDVDLSGSGGAFGVRLKKTVKKDAKK